MITLKKMDQHIQHSRKRQRQSLSSESREEQIHVRKEERASVPRKNGTPRAAAACETCRLKKVKCNEKQPVCGYCEQHNYSCEYRQQSDHYKDRIIAVLSGRLSHVEQTLAGVSAQSGVLQNEFASANLTPPESVESLVLNDCPPVLLDDSNENYSIESLRHVFASDPHISNPLSKDLEQRIRCPDLTPLACEEARLPLPEASPDEEMIQHDEIMGTVAEFYHRVHSLWPAVCEKVSFEMAVSVKQQGFQENVQSCLILLMVALAKAYQTQVPQQTGLPEFQRATRVLSRIGVKFTLEFAQAHILAAGFLLKTGRLLDFWASLNTGCTILYKVIHLDAITGRERTRDERNSTLRVYWLCYNLERDLNHEFSLTPTTPLHRLEDTLRLPQGCDEIGTAHLPEPFRTIQTFFLAEMSLKATLSRILATPPSDFFIEAPSTSTSTSTSTSPCPSSSPLRESPLFQEFRTQLASWIDMMPGFVHWSRELGRGECSPMATRLKLLYWWARMLLYRPLVVWVLKDPGQKLPFAVWRLFQEGLGAGVTMVRIAVVEETDIDVLMGNRLITAISLLKCAAAVEDCVPTLEDENIHDVLQQGVDVLRERLGYKSEWINYRLHTL